LIFNTKKGEDGLINGLINPKAKSFFGGLGNLIKSNSIKQKLVIPIEPKVEGETIANSIRDAIQSGVYDRDYLRGFFGNEETEKAADEFIQKLIETGDIADITGENLSTAINKYRESQDQAIQEANVFQKSVSNIGKAIVGTLANMAVSFAVTWAISEAIKYFDGLIHKSEQLQNAIKETEGTINSLKSEIEQLEAIDYRTVDQQKRLESLREELKIQERIYEIELKRATKSKYGEGITDLFNSDNYLARISKETTNQNNPDSLKRKTAEYKQNQKKIEALQKRRDYWLQLSESETHSSKFRQYSEKQFDKADEELTKLEDKRTDQIVELQSKVAEYDSAINELEQDLASGYLSAQEKIDATSYLHAFKQLKDEALSVINEFQKDTGEYDWSNTIESIFEHVEFDGVKDRLIELGKDGNLSIESLTHNFDPLIRAMDEAGVSAEVLYNWIMNLADPFKQERQNLANKIAGSFNKTKYDSRGIAINQAPEIQAYLDSLTDEEYQIVAGIDIDWSTFDAESAIARMNSEVEKAGKIEVPVETSESDIVDSVKGINERLKTQFDEIGKAYQAIFNGDKFSLDDIDFEGIRKSFLEIGKEAEDDEVLGKYFENGREAVNKFIDTLTDADLKTKSLEEQQEVAHQAINDLATAYFYSADGLAELNDETRDAITVLLEQLGVANAAEVVAGYMDRYAEAERAATQAGLDLATATGSEILHLRNEGTVSTETAQQMAILAAQKLLLKDNPLSTAEDCQQLASLIGMLELTGVECGNLQLAIAQLGSDEIMSEERKKTIISAAQRRINEIAKGKLNFELDIKIPTDTTKDLGGAKDAAEDLSDVLSKINSQIDEIQDSYQKLEKIQEDYNSTGKISIDQAQELSNMDFRYLAQLKVTTDELDLQKDSWDELTKAKINDLKVAMIQKAMDLISTFQNEAVALQYLQNSYVEAADAALTLVNAEAQYQALYASFGKNGQDAAKMVWEGLNNALTMMDNIDLNLHVDKEGREGVDHSSSEHGGKTPEQEAFEEAVKEAEEKLQITYKDWMEVALDKVGKKVDKWTKSVNKLFSFWNKQWAANKAIKAVHEDIDLQKSAYNLYLQQANKAAKKAGRYIKSDDETLTYEIMGEGSLKSKYQKLLKYGAKAIEKFDGTKESKILLEKIEAFTEWYEKAIAAQEAINDLYDQERELIKEKLNSISTYFDRLDDYYNSIVGKIDARLSMRSAAGAKTTIKDLLEQYQANEEVRQNRENELFALATGVRREDQDSVEEAKRKIKEKRTDFDTNTVINPKYEAKAQNKIENLQTRQDRYNELQEEIAKETDKKTKAALKKEAKKIKLSSGQKRLLNYLQQNVDMFAQITEDAITDSATSSTAVYQNLVKRINKLQSKKKLSAKNTKKLNMYLDELAAINSGVAAEDLQDYMKNYEKFWVYQNKIDNGKELTVKEQLKYNKYKKKKEEYENKYQESLTALDDNLNNAEFLESLEDMSTEEKVEAFTEKRNEKLEKDKQDLIDSYDEQRDLIEDSYESSSTFKNLNKEYEKLLTKESKGKLKGKSKKRLEKLAAEMEALQEGATDENIKEYKKTWEEWYDLSQKDRSKLTKAEAKRLDNLRKKLDSWNEEKQALLTDLDKQQSDELEQLELDAKQEINDVSTSLFSSAELAYELAKQIAEWEVTSIQKEIDELNSLIDSYKNVASLLESTSLDYIKKFPGLTKLLGIDGSGDATKLLEDQLVKTISATEKKINKSVSLGEMYQKLIKAGNEDEWHDILSAYRKVDTELVNKLEKQLENDNLSPEEWVAEWTESLNQVTSDTISAVQGIQSVKDELRENVYFKAINNAMAQMDALKSRTDAMSGLFKDEWLFDSEGITEFGLAKAAMLSDQYAEAQHQASNLAAKIAEMDTARVNKTYEGNEEQFWIDRNNLVAQYYQELQSVENVATQLADLAKKKQEEEINRLKKLVDVRQRALENKKKYWQYSENVKNKTKEVEALQAEIDALNGVRDLPLLF